MRKRKSIIDDAICPAGSLEQQLDMCESGTLRGDEVLREDHEHPIFSEDMSEEDREGDEMSGDEHSAGLQGGDSEMQDQEHETGLPGDQTRMEELRAKRLHLPEEAEPTESRRYEQSARRRNR